MMKKGSVYQAFIHKTNGSLRKLLTSLSRKLANQIKESMF